PADMENLELSTHAGDVVDRIICNNLDNNVKVDSPGHYSGPDQGDTGYSSTIFHLIDGGAGNDTIDTTNDPFPGDEFTDDDQLYLERTVQGGLGNDLLIDASYEKFNEYTYLRGGPGRDTLQASSGTVWADYSDLAGPVRVTLDGKVNDGPAGDPDVLGPGV